MIESLLGVGTCSWVMFVNGIHKYLTKNAEDTGKLVAKARPKQTSTPTKSPTATIPCHQREWIDVEPGPYDKNCCEVSEKMIRLLRHDPSVLREEDGAFEFRTRTWMNYLRKGGHKKRLQYCVDPLSADTIF